MKLNPNYKIYLVTDRNVLNDRDFIISIEQAIKGGVSVIQLREKKLSSLEFYKLALEARDLTLKYDIPLIINDRLDIALAVDADGVHIGQKDIPLTIARKIMGNKIIGVSTATLDEALKAENDGADYIGVGALFVTNTKTNTRKVTIDTLKKIKESINIPVVAIGGINQVNVKKLKETNIDGVAVASAILGKDNIEEAVIQLYNKI